MYDSITVSSSTIEPGQPWMLNGSAPGYENIQVWIFGHDEVLFFMQGVKPDGSYTISLLPEKTRDMTPGIYHAVLQFPSEQGVYDIRVKDWKVINTKKPASQQQIFSIIQSAVTPLSPFVYTSFIRALDYPAVNDTYADITFSISPLLSTESVTIQEPITIHPVGDHTVGDRFVINGTTNLFTGQEILVQIMSSSFRPGPKIPEGMREGTTGTTHIIGNDGGENTWNFPVDTTHWLADEYLISAAAVKGNATASAIFTLYSGSIHIDPVDNHTVGDTFTITGTSVLSELDPLYVTIVYRPRIHTKNTGAGQSYCGNSGGPVITVERSNKRFWSYSLNTSGCYPGTYVAEVFSGSGMVKGDTQSFILSPDSSTAPDQKPVSSPASYGKGIPTPPSTPRPAPVLVIIPLAALGLCAIVSVLFRRMR